jgi:hypothetical protein
MKILKAKTGTNKKVFDIKQLSYITDSATIPLKDLMLGEDMINPIEVLKHVISETPRMGAAGMPYIEKEWSVYKGNQRVKAALQLGYTHIEGIIINE